MVRGEDGEFELILGNRQLLSVFFIVVALLGVFFTMGYIVGKNAGSSDVLAGKREPLVVDPSAPRKEPTSGTVIDPREKETEKPPVVVESPKPVESKPVETKQESKKSKEPEPVAVKEPPKKEKAEPKKAEAKPEPVPEPPKKQASIGNNGEPSPGQTFLQVVASTRPDCEMIASVLKRKGFAASVVPGPNDNVFRVLVGPLLDAGSVSKARTDLEAVGFQKPIVRKY